MTTERKAAARVGTVGLMEGQWSFQLHDGTDDPIGFIAFFFDDKTRALKGAKAMRAIVASASEVAVTSDDGWYRVPVVMA